MFDIVGVLILLFVLVLFGWLARRAWHAQRPFTKWTGTIASGILALVVGVLLGAALFGYWKLNRTYENPVPQISVVATPENVARGARFEPLCAGCHAQETGRPMTRAQFPWRGGAPDRHLLFSEPNACASSSVV